MASLWIKVDFDNFFGRFSYFVSVLCYKSAQRSDLFWTPHNLADMLCAFYELNLVKEKLKLLSVGNTEN